MEGGSSLQNEPLTLSLRPWPKEDPNANSLPSLLQRIIQQKGHFRNVTEKSLEREIRALEARKSSSEASDVQSDDGDASRKDESRRDEGAVAAREEILKEVGQAYVEAYHALDFVSLLLSKETPRQAEISMSQHLKQHVPLGSLGVEKVQVEQESDAAIKDRELVSRGWKLNSLTMAADSLLHSARRLEKEVEREGRYWEQALAISQRGWSLCRMPRDKHTLGVRFGFREAATEFRERGLATLRYGEDGKVVLDQGIEHHTARGIRVCITNKNKTILGSSALPPVTDADAPIEQLVLQARNSIYDEELFHEINREALTLANQGVKHHHSTVVLTLPEQQVLVDLVALNTEGTVSSNAFTHHMLANSIAMAFRILLGHAHRLNYNRRTQVPLPITESRPPIPPYSIIRPVLTHLFHQHEIRSLRDFFKRLMAPLRSAHLPVEVTLSMGVESSLQSNPASMLGEVLVTTQQVVEAFANSTESVFDMTLPGRKQISVTVRTQLEPPTLGTEYIVDTRGNLSADFADGSRTAEELVPPRTRFDSDREMKRHLQHLITMSITAEAMRWIREAGQPSTGRLQNGVGSNDHAPNVWAHALSFNEFTMTSPNVAHIKRFRILLSDQGLELRWGSANGAVGKGQGRVVWGFETKGEERALREVLEMS